MKPTLEDALLLAVCRHRGQTDKAGQPESVVRAVDHLTKTPEGERDYQLAIERAALDTIARKVKIADLTDNMDLTRIAHPSEKDRERIEKYRRAKAFLESF